MGQRETGQRQDTVTMATEVRRQLRDDIGVAVAVRRKRTGRPFYMKQAHAEALALWLEREQKVGEQKE
jgi:hypothetical protein